MGINKNPPLHVIVRLASRGPFIDKDTHRDNVNKFATLPQCLARPSLFDKSTIFVSTFVALKVRHSHFSVCRNCALVRLINGELHPVKPEFFETVSNCPFHRLCPIPPSLKLSPQCYSERRIPVLGSPQVQRQGAHRFSCLFQLHNYKEPGFFCPFLRDLFPRLSLWGEKPGL